jgi:hypothetical protein
LGRYIYLNLVKEEKEREYRREKWRVERGEDGKKVSGKRNTNDLK